jgi:hypothetical protein
MAERLTDVWQTAPFSRSGNRPHRARSLASPEPRRPAAIAAASGDARILRRDVSAVSFTSTSWPRYEFSHPTGRFGSLDAQNAFLRHWNRTIARLRIHGITRRPVWTHFVEVEQRALQPLAVEAFPYLASGERTVHTDGHVEVAGAFFYSVPLALLGQRLRVRWDAHLVRVFHGDTLVMVHARVATGVFAPRAGEAEASTRQQAYVDRLVGQCARVGPALQQWADAALAARGVRAIRLIQGVLGLTRRHPRERR